MKDKMRKYWKMVLLRQFVLIDEISVQYYALY